MQLPIQTDTWSLAATLLHMLTGEPPYAHMTTPKILMQLGPKETPPTLPPEGLVGAALVSLLQRCFSFDPGARPSLQEVLQVWPHACCSAQTSGCSDNTPAEACMHKACSSQTHSQARLILSWPSCAFGKIKVQPDDALHVCFRSWETRRSTGFLEQCAGS